MNLNTYTSGAKIFHNFLWNGFGYRSDLIDSDYMRRWVIYTPIGCIRLHHILRSDNERHHHDHPFHFLSLILRGGYIEHRPDEPPEQHLPGSFVFRFAKDLHYLKLIEKDAWTLVFASNPMRRWGFKTEDGWIDARNYDAYLEKRDAPAQAQRWPILEQ